MRLSVVSLALLLVLGPASANDSSAAFAPASSLAVQSDAAGVIVSWEPGEELADTYRVYGVTGSARTLLAEWTVPVPEGAQVTVPNGYEEYGVAGVKDEMESPLIMARIVDPEKIIDPDNPPCVSISITIPPGVSTCLDLMRHFPGKVMFGFHSQVTQSIIG